MAQKLLVLMYYISILRWIQDRIVSKRLYAAEQLLWEKVYAILDKDPS